MTPRRAPDDCDRLRPPENFCFPLNKNTPKRILVATLFCNSYFRTQIPSSCSRPGGLLQRVRIYTGETGLRHQVRFVWNTRKCSVTLRSFRGLFQTVFGLFLVVSLAAFMVPVPKDNKHFLTLPLPPGRHLDDHLLFASRDGQRFLFFNPDGPAVLHLFKIDRPMGSPYFFHEQWTDLPIPSPETLSRISAMALGNHLAYLSGLNPSGEPILRVLNLSPNQRHITGYTDFMPKSGRTPIRELTLDKANETLWITFNNGEVLNGHSLLLTPGTILSSSPLEALTEHLLKGSPEGPETLPAIRRSRIQNNDCLSCRLFILTRERPDGKTVPNLPIRTPVPVDSSMGMIPIGLTGALFAGDPSIVCQIPSREVSTKIGPCHQVDTATLPSDGILSGTRETFLLHLKRRSDWTLATINRTYLEDAISHRRPLARDFPTSLLLKEAVINRFPDNAHPIPGFWATDQKKLAIFGHRHLYILFYDR